MTTNIDSVPKWARILVGVLSLLNIVFGVMGYFEVNLLFHNSTGLDLENPIFQVASFEFAARNLAIGLALGIVSAKGVPESIAIVTIIRALIEIQTICISLFTSEISLKILMPVIFLIIEILIIRTMIMVIEKRDSH